MDKELFEFSVAPFVERSVRNLIAETDRREFRGLVFGASGGIDSMVTAALCLRAKEKRHEWQVVAFQINDSRVKGELYNAEIYRSLGADLIQADITAEAIHMEKRLGMPPRWLSLFLIKLALRYLPTRVRRRMILAVMAGEAPGSLLIHRQLLTLLHVLRIARLREYANGHGLMLVICANMTELLLGYFVEQGVDDPRMGDLAPLSGLYKSQVVRVAQFMGLPEHIIQQRPSPGFGGIYDEQIIGPYDMVDRVLAGLQLGYSDSEICNVIRPHVRERRGEVPFRRKGSYDTKYIGFIRQLAELNAQKRCSENRKE